MPPNERLNGGKLDLVIFADQFTLGVSSKRPKAMGTMRRLMILNGIGRFAQFTRMAFVMVDLNKARDGKEILASLGSA